MDDYAGRVLADRYRLPLPPPDGPEPLTVRAWDTYSGQRVLLRRIPLPEVVEAELVGGAPADASGRPGPGGPDDGSGRPARSASRDAHDPVVRRAVDAATAAASLPDHPRLDQVFHVFAEDGDLWIVSEFVAGRPLAALLAEGPLSPHRAAEVAADVLTALRAVHAHGWVHRNITADTVVICEDGRAMLTGLAAAAAEEALCGHDPVPPAPPAPLSPPDRHRGPGRPGDGGRVPRARDAGYADGRGGTPGTGARDEGGAAPAPRGAVPQPRTGDAVVAPAGRDPHPRGTAGAAPAARGPLAPRPLGSGPAGSDVPAGAPDGGRPDRAPAGRRGPATPLAAERARLARLALVGAVTERWAPEQAGPAHAGPPPADTPATDLWAVGALLFRAVRGHAPYPEDDPVALVREVATRAPAHADGCGPLRPLVEALLGRDPAARPDAEDVRARLRALVRSAPEPEVGSRTVVVPHPDSGGPAGARRLPVVRRRGPLVRRARTRGPVVPRARRRAVRPAEAPPSREPAAIRIPDAPRRSRGPREPAIGRGRRHPRNLGLVLLLAILALLVAGVLFAVLFLPESEPSGTDGARRPAPAGGTADRPGDGGRADDGRGDGRSPQTTRPPGLPRGFVVRDDPAGFRVAVPGSWTRRGENDRGQVRYRGGDFELLVVAGRDRATEVGTDPMAYQQTREPELAAFRASSWSSASQLRRTDVGRTATAEGEFRWRDAGGRQVCARNLAMLLAGRYHIVQVIGPADEPEAVARYFRHAVARYAAAG
ncbi:serine/threonine protein kinase [Streptomyces pactum]|uniref:Serine/threonine protein kinase n=1 Tax=Streptomyces pactum TaxID=68249 RepID=A0ABS0NJH9_9ACTN|nr:protein kinase [Streptomyces pactum]MBH5335313.1 serine/threonine protein kinase [Streptomyces pactum]